MKVEVDMAISIIDEDGNKIGPVYSEKKIHNTTPEYTPLGTIEHLTLNWAYCTGIGPEDRYD